MVCLATLSQAWLPFGSTRRAGSRSPTRLCVALSVWSTVRTQFDPHVLRLLEQLTQAHPAINDDDNMDEVGRASLELVGGYHVVPASSGEQGLEDRQRFAGLGVAGVLTKPFDPMSTQVAEILGWET